VTTSFQPITSTVSSSAETTHKDPPTQPSPGIENATEIEDNGGKKPTTESVLLAESKTQVILEKVMNIDETAREETHVNTTHDGDTFASIKSSLNEDETDDSDVLYDSHEDIVIDVEDENNVTTVAIAETSLKAIPELNTTAEPIKDEIIEETVITPTQDHSNVERHPHRQNHGKVTDQEHPHDDDLKVQIHEKLEVKEVVPIKDTFETESVEDLESSIETNIHLLTDIDKSKKIPVGMTLPKLDELPPLPDLKDLGPIPDLANLPPLSRPDFTHGDIPDLDDLPDIDDLPQLHDEHLTEMDANILTHLTGKHKDGVKDLGQSSEETSDGAIVTESILHNINNGETLSTDKAVNSNDIAPQELKIHTDIKDLHTDDIKNSELPPDKVLKDTLKVHDSERTLEEAASDAEHVSNADIKPLDPFKAPTGDGPMLPDMVMLGSMGKLQSLPSVGDKRRDEYDWQPSDWTEVNYVLLYSK